MSLTLALQNALTGVSVSQVGLSVTSGNIANANTEGYTRKIANLGTRVVGNQQGQGAGVQINSITRNINQTVQQEMRRQTATVGRSEVMQEYAGRTESLFGSVSSDDSLSAEIVEFSNLLDAIAVAPDDPIRHNELINMAQRLTNDIRQASKDIQTIRRDIDQEIQRSVQIINQDIARIEELNGKITKNEALGLPSGDMQDQRDTAILRVNEQLDINIFKRSNEEVVIYTNKGVKLLDSSAQQLTYTAVSAIDSSSSFIEGNFSKIGIENYDLDVDLTSQVVNGRLSGLIEMRDKFLPNMANELENIAQQLTTAVNGIHNKGTAYPPPSSLTGTRSINATDPFYATGSMRFTVMNEKSELIDYVDIDMTTLPVPGTVNDLVTAISTATSQINAQPFSNYMDVQVVDQKLTLSAVTLGYKVAVGTPEFPATQAIEKVTGKNLNVSQFFGLNDFFVFDSANNNPTKIISNDVLLPTNDIASTGSLRLSVTNSNGTVKNSFDLDMATLGASATVADFIAAVNGAVGLDMTASLREDGRLKLESDDDTEGVEISLLSPAATHTKTGENLLSLLNLKDLRHTSSNIEVREDLIENPSLVSRGELNGQVYTGFQTKPIAMVTAGNADIAQELANVFKETTTFDTVGNIATITTTIPEYASLFLGSNATQNRDLQDRYAADFAVFSELELQNSSASGVDVEQEMANLIVLENAYNASAQVLRVAQQMFERLDVIFS